MLSLALGGFFVWSGVVKLMDLGAFVETVGNYQMVERPWDARVGYFLPWLEVFAGLAVILGVGRRGGLLVIMGMLVFFSGAIAWVWHQGLNINCGCFGKSEEPTNYGLHLRANFGLLVVAVGLFWTRVRQMSRKRT